ncbi:hypothetical protein STAS_33375 [Striga asiatica]|uniref:GOLD domain-containing protein n=1 Tax=Striga asiatica TaxID=4170 RepID=A0A5A7RE53_STRAF|nr:hypothetical protein STAS_33375 [Striga asiatica]
MASTEGLVPITRTFLASYYDKYPFSPLSDDVSRLSDQMYAMAADLLKASPPTQGERLLVQEAEAKPPHKVDENMWKNREQIEEILFLLEARHWPGALQQQLSAEDAEIASVLGRIQEKFKSTLKTLEDFQTRNSEFVFNTGSLQNAILGICLSTSTCGNGGTLMVFCIFSISSSFIFFTEEIENQEALDCRVSGYGPNAENLVSSNFRHSLLYFNMSDSQFQDPVMTYMPQDFRGTIIRQQRERSERNKQAAIDALVNSGGSIHDKYVLLWNQQMERRRQLAELGSATGVYKTLMKYLVGVPEVLMDFVRQINDDQGPMEEQRQRYGPPLYSLTKMVHNIRLYVSLLWGRFEFRKLDDSRAFNLDHQISILEEATDVYSSEVERFINFIREVFTNSPFLISAEDAGTLSASKNDDYKEISVSAGETYEVALTVESVNSYIAWDFSLVQGKMNMDIGFSVECTDLSGRKTLILPYRRYDADQGNFCTCVSGNYKLIWDNSYSAFFKKVLWYKVDCIPPVVDSVSASDQ